jgi:phosphopantetheinyl transferase (holo-ACP synthase)
VESEIDGQGQPEPPQPGIGLDAEQVSRFDKLAAGARPWRYVYTEREVEHCAAQPLAARAFCVAFSCKEAFCKALGEAYSFPQFECLYRPGAAEPDIVLAPELKLRLGVGEVRVCVDEQHLDERGEMLVEVYLIRTAGRRRETLPVAQVAAGRQLIAAEHHLPREIDDLGKRAVQSLAGSFALKRALVGLWASVGAVTTPRDFELGHLPSGAPRLVAAPSGLAPADVFVSISHTRNWAYGLAALRVREGKTS